MITQGLQNCVNIDFYHYDLFCIMHTSHSVWFYISATVKTTWEDLFLILMFGCWKNERLS